mmetsp:Transcript_19090/g.31120  ORF Transcript_19090/g.31120 Transcript_19090/m.31120 type:complete len:108 (+) Transcript_19090:1146-1469(+)
MATHIAMNNVDKRLRGTDKERETTKSKNLPTLAQKENQHRMRKRLLKRLPLCPGERGKKQSPCKKREEVKPSCDHESASEKCKSDEKSTSNELCRNSSVETNWTQQA